MWLHLVIHIRVQVTTSPANWRLLPNARLNWADVVDGGQALNEHWINIWCLLGINDSPANTQHLYNICTMLDQRRRRWADVVQKLYNCFVFAGSEINSQGQGQRKRGYLTNILLHFTCILTNFWSILFYAEYSYWDSSMRETSQYSCYESVSRLGRLGLIRE